ncbi:MAG: hypothetical protein EG823_00640 [Actinobacteria bacterium]|nr:hypothetical protein [Actinomycetota bacterium]
MASTLACVSADSRGIETPSRRVATMGALLSAACILGLVEASLPSIPFAPWLRFGLANIAVVASLALYGFRTAALVSAGRLVIVGLASGLLAGPSFVLAVSGAAASLVVMWAVSVWLRGATIIGWSAAGSAAHVLAQFLAAAVLLDAPSLLVIAPPSVLVALVLGALVGYLARIPISRLKQG